MEYLSKADEIFEEGKAEGKNEERSKNIRNLLKHFSCAAVAEMLELPLEEVEKEKI